MHPMNMTPKELVNQIYLDSNATDRERAFAAKVEVVIDDLVDAQREVANLRMRVARLEQQIDA